MLQYLKGLPLKYRKTQTVEIFDSQFIDTPGEFVEQRRFTGALMVSSVEADVILLVQSAVDNDTMFPPAFTSLFTKPMLGVVTKSDIATSDQIEKASHYLRNAGVTQIFVISSFADTGFEELLDCINLC